MNPAIAWLVFGVQLVTTPPVEQIGEFDGALGENAGAKGAISTTWL
jgi:hypothetical protein